MHAPAAGSGDSDLFPDFVDKAAVLIVRLARNHPLPDGNKRAAWVALRAFVDLNGWLWNRRPDIGEAEHAVIAITAGDWDEEAAAVMAPPSPHTAGGVLTAHPKRERSEALTSQR